MGTKNKSYEADNVSGINHEGAAANTPTQRLTATSIIGDKVENLEGENLGTIDNLMIDIRNEKIEYAVIEFESFLGMGGKLFAVPFAELQIKPGEHTFIYNRDKEYLKESPGFDKDHWPGTNDPYYKDVNLYYRVSSDAFTP
jgi:sporulation protein YlmC with PRC-barrel domain